VEHDLGRERGCSAGGRTLDLDLIAAGDLVLPDRATFEHWRDLPPEAQHAEPRPTG
jgi:2-amino-4-hydroxy-6-hydroxymethyldihydropteridine diphosphokinase